MGSLQRTQLPARCLPVWAWQQSTILPMSNDRVATQLDTDEGTLDFQHYFLARRCVPKVSRIRFDGAESARPATSVIAAIAEADVVLVAPSNPFLSIDPLLAVPGIRLANVSIAAHYDDCIDGLVIDTGDDAPEGLAVARADR